MKMRGVWLRQTEGFQEGGPRGAGSKQAGRQATDAEAGAGAGAGEEPWGLLSLTEPHHDRGQPWLCLSPHQPQSINQSSPTTALIRHPTVHQPPPPPPSPSPPPINQLHHTHTQPPEEVYLAVADGSCHITQSQLSACQSHDNSRAKAALSLQSITVYIVNVYKVNSKFYV